jgi:hypothetical protein
MWELIDSAVRQVRSARRPSGAAEGRGNAHPPVQATHAALSRIAEVSGPVLVSAEADFITHLQDGDVLLFDKLSTLNRLVQWGDNRPAGHAAVWHQDGVYEATRPDLPEGSRGGVVHTPFGDLMGLTTVDDRGVVPLVRTVTALRHRELTEEARRSIQAYLEGCTKAGFGVWDMVFLTPFALERSRAAGGATAGYPQRVIEAWAFYAKKRLMAASNGENVFCSQLVYRAFKQAKLDVEVTDALYERYQSRDHLRMFRRGEAEPVPEDPWLKELFEYEDVFTQQVLDQMPAVELEPTATAEDDEVDPLMQFRGSGKHDARRTGDVGDMVTPGDLWSSPSFDCIAVLHRPAGA